MKRIIGLILIGLGAMLVVLAPLSRFYIAPSAAVAPLNTNSVSTGVGVVVKQLDLVKFASGDPDPYYPANLPMKQTRNTIGNVNASTQDPAKSEGLAVYDTFVRVNVPDGRIVSASTSRYAFNRKSSELANCCGANEGGKTANFSGLFPLKFPFFTQKQTYQVWDGTLLKSVPNVFDSVEEHAGLSTYKFVSTIPPTMVPNSATTVPGKAVGATADVAANIWYSNKVITWVEPLTGQIVDSSSQLLQTLRGPDNTTDLATIAQVQGAGDPAYVDSAAKSIGKDAAKLNLFMTTIPIVGLIGGIILLIVGFLLVRSANRTKVQSGGLAGVGLDAPAPPRAN